MTNPKWLTGILTLFVILTLFSGLLEGAYLGAGEVSKLRVLMSPDFPPSLAWFSNVWGVLWFDYAFFHGSWVIFRYAIFWPITIGLLVSYGALLFQAVVVAFRSLIPRLPI